uniref:Uncharacterized protein n=1 Tax=Knipowitschia caucasica TaxID=637954 RepID=A0AAV2LGN3_KNICA
MALAKQLHPPPRGKDFTFLC